MAHDGPEGDHAVMSKVLPSEEQRNQLQAFFQQLGSQEDGAEALSQLVRMATQLIVQEALEAEQTDFIGRGHYERGEGQGHRSGYVDGHLDTAEGRVSVQRPQVRDAGQPYRSRLYEVLRGDSEMVQQLAIEMYARGLSTRDVEDALTDENGVCLLSKSGVSEVTEALWAEYEAFQGRDLSTIPVLYVFLDGLYEPLRTHGIEREAVLCAWAITLEGKKVLLSLSLGNKESYQAWLGFLRDLVSRGLPTPLTVTTDGAPGLLRAVDEVWADSLRLRCWVHRMRNFQAKVPPSRWPEIKAHLQAIRDAPRHDAGEAAAKDFLQAFGQELPSLCSIFSEDLDALLNHLKLPWTHRKFIRTTNLIERAFVEERRRTKTLPRFFTEKSCLKLVYAVLIRAAKRWQAVHITELEHQQIQLLFQKQKIDPIVYEAVA